MYSEEDPPPALSTPGPHDGYAGLVELLRVFRAVCLCIAAQLRRVAGWSKMNHIATVECESHTVGVIDSRYLAKGAAEELSEGFCVR